MWIMFFDFSSAFNTIQLVLLGDKLELTRVDQQLTSWILDYLTNQQQYVRTWDYVSDTVVCITGAPQGTVLAPFLFTLYTTDFSHKSPHSHLQKYSADSAIVGLIRDGDDRAYRELFQDFIDWCQQNHLQLNAGKTKELVLDFSRDRPTCTSRERKLTLWHLTRTWKFTWTICWTGLITLQQHIRKVNSDSICWESSGPLECRGHSWLRSMTLMASAIFYLIQVFLVCRGCTI